jgi:hypothetical protein
MPFNPELRAFEAGTFQGFSFNAERLWALICSSLNHQ